MNFEEIRELEDHTQVATYAKMPLAVEKGTGSWIWTSEGERYLDLYGGHAVCAVGHAHPAVAKAIGEQTEKLLFYSNLVYSEVRAATAEKLVSLAPPALNKAFFCNSGTEANESAMRMARLATGRAKVISFTGSFHGRTADAISASFLGRYRELGRPNVPGHLEAEFGDIKSVRKLADEKTAAIILEPIQSMAGMREAEPTFFQALRKLCDEHGIILIFDEIQTGIGRTGEWFFSGSSNAGGIQPDIVSLAKSLGSGVPVGACLVNENIASHIKVNDLGTTFGGGMLAMAAVRATLEAIETEDMIANARAIELHLREHLTGIPGIKAIRGKGCLIGIQFDSPCRVINEKLFAKHIISGMSSDPCVLRLLMPMNIRKEELDIFIDAVKEISHV